jgi:microcystin-dependent protein
MALTTVTADVGGTGQTSFPSPGTSGNVLQSNGTVWSSAANPPAFTTGTAMLFQQTSAPTGWTKVTTYNDYAIRIVSGTASTGGSTGFSSVFTNQTPTINVSGLSAGATTLSTAQMPSHSHTLYALMCCAGGVRGLPNLRNCGATSTTQNTGGGGSHTHSISGSATSSAVTLAVQYVDHIIATKN